MLHATIATVAKKGSSTVKPLMASNLSSDKTQVSAAHLDRRKFPLCPSLCRAIGALVQTTSHADVAIRPKKPHRILTSDGARKTCATFPPVLPRNQKGAIIPEIIFKAMSGLQKAGRLVDERWKAGGNDRSGKLIKGSRTCVSW